MILLSIITLLAAVCPDIIMAMDCAGSYKLVSARDNAKQNTVSIPSGEFILNIAPTDNPHQYQMSIKIGNVLRAGLSVKEGSSIEVGPVMSTRMLPAPPLHNLELELSKLLPTMKSMNHVADELILVGDDGELRFVDQNTSEATD